MTGTPKHNAAVTDVLVRLEAQLKAARTHLAYVRRIEATDSYAAAEESVEIWATLYDAVDDGILEPLRKHGIGTCGVALMQLDEPLDPARKACLRCGHHFLAHWPDQGCRDCSCIAGMTPYSRPAERVDGGEI